MCCVTSEPRWSRRAGAAVATERVTLYGVPLVTDRTIQYARIDPEAARDIFIRSALVEGDWDPHHEFWKHNRRTLERVAELEERARRRDIVVDDEVVHAFYDARIPPDVVSERHFDRWWRGERRRRPDLLTLTEELLTSAAGEEVSASDYPRTWRQGDVLSGVFYGWLNNNHATTVQYKLGKGKVIFTTLDTSAYGKDLFVTHLVHRLVEYVRSDRCAPASTLPRR